ncbi:helix-turn-helix domain-containing protein [Motiliproteus sp. SC1-56]|uniref:winged helix-turn-helix transcriptional regulator n=1 Tax=Motiliproteus sp. SC1-56 TaxID=2799565 RepID=UPI001A9010A9|nr:helix-turn-helix domain-containing protein [Motiliproteus sp. SC1-56]
MKGYGQFCPIAKASEVLGERWTHLVVRELGAGSETFNDLRRGLPLISPSLLSTRLKTLERAGVAERCEEEGGVRYHLTDAGQDLLPIIMQLGTWGHRWVRSDLSAEDLDPSLLVWDIHRTIDTAFFKAERTVIQIEFTDYTSKFRHWWLVITDDVDVCLKDQGYEVDLKISSDLKTLTAVWMGDTTIMNAIREHALEVEGSPHLKKNIAVWLGGSFYADVKPAR